MEKRIYVFNANSVSVVFQEFVVIFFFVATRNCCSIQDLFKYVH